MTRYLIVNADDFGASRGINRGIIEAHHHGILTSASLMVDTPWSEEAAMLSHTAPDLSVGLHVDLTDQHDCRTDLQRQFRRFQELIGRLPTHLDSHHNRHQEPGAIHHFIALAEHYGVPLRGHSAARPFSKFYGQWDGETHLEQISVASLIHMLTTQIGDGVTELSCHPGYIDPDFRSSYSAERMAELHTLCNLAIRQAVAEQAIQLINFHKLNQLPSAILNAR